MLPDEHIPDLLAARAARSVVVIGPDAEHAASRFSSLHPDAEVASIADSEPLAHIEALGRQDLALVVNALEFMDKPTARVLVSRLRDLYSRCLIVIIRLAGPASMTHSDWVETDLLALGLKQMGLKQIGVRDNAPGTLGIYEFNIKDYKLNPDWLNAKYWANPELWEKYRW
jgi:hypothetical protein